MKKSVFILGCTLWGVSLSAQNENVQYQLLEGYSSSRAFNPKHIAVPDLPGYKTLKRRIVMSLTIKPSQWLKVKELR